ncbi:aspartate--tRNA ligase, partial [bacterium]|nr:aspartate--tRNA ligase [bacterium]
MRKEDEGQDVVLVGWAARVRDHGGVVFINLRDRWGVTQIVVNPDNKYYQTAKSMHMESVIGVRGKVSLRPENMINKSMDTGEIEVYADDLIIFNPSKPLPFLISDEV